MESCAGAHGLQGHVSLSQDFVSSWVSFRREVIWSTPGHSPCIGLRTFLSTGFLFCTLQSLAISGALSSMTQFLFSNVLHSGKHGGFKMALTFPLLGSLLWPSCSGCYLRWTPCWSSPFFLTCKMRIAIVIVSKCCCGGLNMLIYVKCFAYFLACSKHSLRIFCYLPKDKRRNLTSFQTEWICYVICKGGWG